MLLTLLRFQTPLVLFCRHTYRFLYLFLLVIVLSSLVNKCSGQNQRDTDGPKKDHRQIIQEFFEKQASVRYVYSTQINRAGSTVVWNTDGTDGHQEIYFASLKNPQNKTRVTAFTGDKKGNESEPQWSPDGKEIAFLSESATPGQLQLFIANTSSGKIITSKPLSHFEGYISHLKWSPDGKYLSVLYVPKASREPSPMAATDRATGLIDSLVNKNVQRVAVIDPSSGGTRLVSPTGLYVFEYDWSPDSQSFVYTATLPPGDNNWYIARLYRQSADKTDTLLLYQPVRQIALPRWSADGKQIAFIEGLMSDQGGTGGEIYTISSSGQSAPRNLTPGRLSTPSWFQWRVDGNIMFTEFQGGSVAIQLLNTSKAITTPLWKADEFIRAGIEETSLSVNTATGHPMFAFIRSSWNSLPEVWAGELNKLQQVTRLNAGVDQRMPTAVNVEWNNEGYSVQGWLLYPANYDSTKKYPMLVAVHGGPAWISTPTWSAPDFNTTVYAQLGYFIFFPNPRGSYGQGEKFTQANVKDWGFGDLRDITSGVDYIAHRLPIDTVRVGILGWSYGGYMSMFAVTQTNKFRAAVAGAGAGDWLSYYGQNSIDKFMQAYFGVSPYFDPAPYAKSSAMTYIKNVKTPILLLVGELDGEAPAMQSMQYWHALKELNVPTQLMIYANEGHSFQKFENMIDVSVRTYEWFDRYLHE